MTAAKRFHIFLTPIGLAMICIATSTAILRATPPHDPDQSTRERLLAIVGDGFQIRETDHFTIAYNAPYETLRPMMGRLEGIYDAVWRFCQGMHLHVKPIPQPLAVLLFDTFEEFKEYSAGVGVQADAMAGFYLHQTNIATFYNTAGNPSLRRIAAWITSAQARLRHLGTGGDRRRRQAMMQEVTMLQVKRNDIVKTYNRFVIQHEAAHQILFNLDVHVRHGDNPTWLVEGIACHFEVPQTPTDGIPRKVNHMRLGDFRDALEVATGTTKITSEHHMAVRKGRRFVSISRLVGDPDVFAMAGDKVAFRYAQAWALVYFLHQKHFEGFSGYLQQLRKRQPGVVVRPEQMVKEFVSAFGRPDLEFERGWIAYMLKLRFEPNKAGL